MNKKMTVAALLCVLGAAACSAEADRQAQQGQAGYANDVAGGGNTGAPGTSPPGVKP